MPLSALAMRRPLDFTCTRNRHSLQIAFESSNTTVPFCTAPRVRRPFRHAFNAPLHILLFGAVRCMARTIRDAAARQAAADGAAARAARRVRHTKRETHDGRVS
ncbi:hypothetical protein BURMUCGD1_3836 [Burkholderia multivorans CGD1]|nr:hypothetical protein BURMUCGD1_3836 [Burkholderia multivorans CGD1]